MTTDRYARRFTVHGIDEDGDVQAFHTDSPAHAASVYKQMKADLEEVELIDAERD
jgi:hypothetical protein